MPIRADVAVHYARGSRHAATHSSLIKGTVLEFSAGGSLEHIDHRIEVMPMKFVLGAKGLLNRMPAVADDLRQGLFLGREWPSALMNCMVGSGGCQG